MLPVTVHMLWVRGALSQLEALCIASFVSKGYRVRLWTYGGVSNPPHGIDLCDARDVLPEESLFLNQLGSYAGFSDLFRYAVLRQHGGMYADVDVIAIMPADQLPGVPFLVTERARDGSVKVNGNIIHLPQPCAGDLIDLAFAYASAFPKEQVSWSEIGPSLLTAIVGIHPRHGFAIMPPDFANPVDWWTVPDALLASATPPECFFLHLYNDMWRRARVNKNSPFPPGSLVLRALGEELERPGPA